MAQAQHIAPSTHSRIKTAFLAVLVCAVVVCVCWGFERVKLYYATEAAPGPVNAELMDALNPALSVELAPAELDAESVLGPLTPDYDASLGAQIQEAQTPRGLSVLAPVGFLTTGAAYQLDYEIAQIEEAGYSVGLVLIDLTTERNLSYRATELFYPASTIKAPFCTMVFESYGQGLSDYQHQSIARCIIDSSNDDYHNLIGSFSIESFGAWTEPYLSESRADTYIDYYPWLEPIELARMWYEIYQFCSTPEGEELASYLSQTETNALGAVLRSDYEVWAKAGWNDSYELEASCDAGIIFSEEGPYLCVIMSNIPSDLEALYPLIDSLDAAHRELFSGS